MVWGKIVSQNGSGTTEVDMPSISSSEFNVILTHSVESAQDQELLFNSDTGSNYAYRRSFSGGTDSTTVSDDALFIGLNAPSFTVSYMCNIATEEKLVLTWSILGNISGAGTAPTRDERVGKWANTSSQINDMTMKNSTTSVNFTSDSNISVLGSDMTLGAAVPAAIQDGLIFEETDTNKHYIYTASTDTWTEI